MCDDTDRPLNDAECRAAMHTREKQLNTLTSAVHGLTRRVADSNVLLERIANLLERLNENERKGS